MHLARIWVFGAVVVVATAPLLAAQEKSSPADELGQKVLAFAKANLDKKIGDGECAALPAAALRAAGAKTVYDYPDNAKIQDLVWGIAVKDVGKAQPGDILQFVGVKIVRTAKKGDKNVKITEELPQHTAIVLENLGQGKFKLYEQNYGMLGAEVKKVQQTEIDLTGIKQGTVKAYRPEKK
jgi:hypothetical protein